MTGYSVTTFVVFCLHLCFESSCCVTFQVNETCIEPYGSILQTIPDCSEISCAFNCNTNAMCRSAVYDAKQRSCTTNNESTTSFPNGCGSQMKYIERGQSSVMDPCSLDRDCATVDSFCKEGTCECLEGLNYSQTEDLCVGSQHLCLLPWIGFNGSCYLFGKSEMNFSTAQDYCVEQSAHLVHVNTLEEHEFLEGYMKGLETSIGTACSPDENYNCYWVGMTDEGEIWNWVGTGEPITLNKWFPGEPNYSYEHCVQYYGILVLEWHNVPCQHLNLPICEK